MPVIVVGRTGGWVDRLRAYRVTCNGVSYRLPANRSVRFDPTHGRVDVRAEIDWVRPAVWTGDVEAEQHLLIRPHHVAAGMFGAGEYLQIVPCRAEDISAPMPPETVRPARAFPSPRLALLRVVLGVVGLLAVRQVPGATDLGPLPSLLVALVFLALLGFTLHAVGLLVQSRRAARVDARG